ncbi:hypothetical protein ACF07D_03950 [Leucobacter sp. NPDC015123]|uniref:sunset domain-containing protein n=1 Tax=Leucobacter sp. NPDC015123 TaxID=3364129 RepID=UPI0036F4749F
MLRITGALLASALVFGATVSADAPAAIAATQALPQTTSTPAQQLEPESPGGVEGPELPEAPAPVGAPTTPPEIVGGSAVVGTAVAASLGVWPDAELEFELSWQRDGVDIGGALGASYTPQPDDLGAALRAAITATARNGESLTVFTEPVIVGPGSMSLAAVSLTGTPAVGSTLQASLAEPAPGDAMLTFRWNRNGVTIPGATAASYTLTAADLGKAITATVEASRYGYSGAVWSSAPTRAVVAGALASKKPTISGTAAVGYTLTGAPGAWGPKPVKLQYQWLRNGAAIPKATGATYKLAAADIGKRITFRVTGTLGGYGTVSQTSGASAAVLRSLATAPAPAVSGTVKVGQTLSAKPGAWKPAPVSLSYQWLRNGSAIKGATKSTYKLTSADGGAKISVRVTGKKSGYLTVAKTSAAKAVPRVLGTAKPAISGTKLVGSKLTVNRGKWTAGASLKTQWLRNGAAITGATGTTYSLTAADAGKRISVRVTGSKSGYTAASQTSAATGNIGYPSRTKPASSWNCPAWAPIKGNANSMIYHVKGGQYYSRTKPEECFTTAAAAQRAGYRASKR